MLPQTPEGKDVEETKRRKTRSQGFEITLMPFPLGEVQVHQAPQDLAYQPAPALVLPRHNGHNSRAA